MSKPHAFCYIQKNGWHFLVIKLPSRTTCTKWSPCTIHAVFEAASPTSLLEPPGDGSWCRWSFGTTDRNRSFGHQPGKVAKKLSQVWRPKLSSQFEDAKIILCILFEGTGKLCLEVKVLGRSNWMHWMQLINSPDFPNIFWTISSNRFKSLFDEFGSVPVTVS